MSKPGWLVCGLALLAPWATVGAQNLGDSAQEWPSTGSTAWQNFDDRKPR